jgi:hypothetical protein
VENYGRQPKSKNLLKGFNAATAVKPLVSTQVLIWFTFKIRRRATNPAAVAPA